MLQPAIETQLDVAISIRVGSLNLKKPSNTCFLIKASIATRYPRPKIKSKTKTGLGTWQESEGRYMWSMVSKGERKRHQHLKNILSHLRRFCWWSPNRSDLPRKQTPWKTLERQRNNFKLGELKKPKLSLSHLGDDKWSVANVSKNVSQ